MFSLGYFWGCRTPPIVQIYPPISVSEAAAPPIRMMACKANLYSIIITKQLLTCKCTAIDCAILTLTEDRSWIRDYSALDSTLLHPYFKILVKTLPPHTLTEGILASSPQVFQCIPPCSRGTRPWACKSNLITRLNMKYKNSIIMQMINTNC